MSRTHHSSQSYRLSCGCIQSYSSVHQTGEVPKAAVLCSNCRNSAYITDRYPPDSCAETCRADNPAGGVIKVRCTEKPGHKGKHFDATVAVAYKTPRKLKAGREGNT